MTDTRQPRPVRRFIAHGRRRDAVSPARDCRDCRDCRYSVEALRERFPDEACVQLFVRRCVRVRARDRTWRQLAYSC